MDLTQRRREERLKLIKRNLVNAYVVEPVPDAWRGLLMLAPTESRAPGRAPKSKGQTQQRATLPARGCSGP
jgi:hypothetical protein